MGLAHQMTVRPVLKDREEKDALNNEKIKTKEPLEVSNRWQFQVHSAWRARKPPKTGAKKEAISKIISRKIHILFPIISQTARMPDKNTREIKIAKNPYLMKTTNN